MVRVPEFIQPRGPVVDVSLFGRASTAGINAGNALPTPFASGVEGTFRGVERGQQIQARSQEAEIRQARIENIPLETQIRQEQLEAAQLSNDINELNIEAAKETRLLTLENQKEKLLNQTEKIKAERATRAREKQLQDVFDRSDAAGRARILTSGEFADVFSKNKDLFRRFAEATLPSITDPQQRQVIQSAMLKNSIVKDYQKRLPQLQINENQAKGELSDSLVMQDLRSGLEIRGVTNLTDDQIVDNTVMVKTGKFQKDTLGRIVQTPGFDNTIETTRDAIYTDPVTGEKSLIELGFEEKQHKPFTKYRGAKQALEGMNERLQIRRLNEGTTGRPSQQRRPTPRPQPGPTVPRLTLSQAQGDRSRVEPRGAAEPSPGSAPVRTRIPDLETAQLLTRWSESSADVNAIEIPGVRVTLKARTGLTDGQLNESAPAIKTIVGGLVSEAQDPAGFLTRIVGGETSEITEAKTDLAKAMSASEFSRVSASPGFASRFNGTELAKYQADRREVVESLNQGQVSAGDVFKFFTGELTTQFTEDVNTIEDLYYVRNKDRFDSAADNFVSFLRPKINDAVKAPDRLESIRQQSVAGLSERASQSTRSVQPALAQPQTAQPAATPTAPEDLAKLNKATNPQISAHIDKVSNDNGVDPELVRAVISQESGSKGQKAVSRKGAKGFMQLMEGTAKDLGVDRDDPFQNIEGGVRFLAQLLEEFGSVELALAAYNAGPGNVRKHGGIPPFPETQQYVEKVLERYGRRT